MNSSDQVYGVQSSAPEWQSSMTIKKSKSLAGSPRAADPNRSTNRGFKRSTICLQIRFLRDKPMIVLLWRPFEKTYPTLTLGLSYGKMAPLVPGNGIAEGNALEINSHCANKLLELIQQICKSFLAKAPRVYTTQLLNPLEGRL